MIESSLFGESGYHVMIQILQTMATSQRKSGFDCEFVNSPKELQSECPVCLQILREPYQAPCCGNNFCRVCIERIKTDNKRCPTCNKENFVTFHNKGLQRSLYGLKVYCSHKQEGCEWKGELGQLDNHLNLSPQPDKQLEGCKYSEIECIYCSMLIKRSNIAVHQNDLCPKRLFSCEYCHSYKSLYEDIINNHWPVCGYHPVRCPNECGTFPQRQALENHVTRDCPNTVIDCDFHHVGCDVRLPRKDMPVHLKENLVTHMSLQAASYGKLLASHNELQNRVKMLENALKQSPPVAFTMENFEQCKKNDEEWFSPPFYTHPGGYKFCLRVDANGHGDHWITGGKGSHVSVYTGLMKGEFDDDLKWPFRGDITVQLVDQEGKEEHHTVIIDFTDRTPDDIAGRVTEGERRKGRGSCKFISKEKLKPKYLKNDCLCFRIANAITYSN